MLQLEVMSRVVDCFLEGCWFLYEELRKAECLGFCKVPWSCISKSLV